VAIFYVLINIEISKESSIFAIVDDALLDRIPSGQPQEGMEPTRWTKNNFIFLAKWNFFPFLLTITTNKVFYLLDTNVGLFKTCIFKLCNP
jgi:hypothetical protein